MQRRRMTPTRTVLDRNIEWSNFPIQAPTEVNKTDLNFSRLTRQNTGMGIGMVLMSA